MILSDFCYDGISCDEYGVFIAAYQGINVGAMDTVKTNLKTEKSRFSNEFKIVSQEYEEPLSFEIQVFNRDKSSISSEQERAIKKWLIQRGKYKWFTILDARYSDVWLKANIHSPKNIRVNDVIGMSFQVSCSTPFVYSDLLEEEFVFNNASRSCMIYVDNDEDSVIYPDMEITMSSAGDLEIYNSLDTNKNHFKITGLKAGEVVTINGSIPSMESTEDTRMNTVYNRFSKYWFSFSDGENEISVSNNCRIVFKYRETRRVGIQ